MMCVMSEGWSGDWRGCERLGVDLVGLSSTGVYVSKVYSESQSDSDRLQIGDQLLEVNSKKIGKSHVCVCEQRRSDIRWLIILG